MARKKRRTGRPAHNRKTGIPRTASGKLSRSKAAKKAKHGHAQAWLEMTERQAIEVGVAQRAKRGIPEEDARDSKHGTVIGRLFKARRITEDELYACQWYMDRLNDYRGAVASPGHVYDRPEDATPSFAEDAYDNWCERARTRWAECERAVCDAVFENRDRDIVGAVTQILHDDLDPGVWKDRVCVDGSITQYIHYDNEQIRRLKKALVYIERVRNGKRRNDRRAA